MTRNGQKDSILLISTADWKAQLRTNKQYMAEELAKEFRVFTWSLHRIEIQI